MSRSACSLRLAPAQMSAPGVVTVQINTKQKPNVKYTPPPSLALRSVLRSARLPLNGTGAANPLPVLRATLIGVPLKTRSSRPSPLRSASVDDDEDWLQLSDAPPAKP